MCKQDTSLTLGGLNHVYVPGKLILFSSTAAVKFCRLKKILFENYQLVIFLNKIFIEQNIPSKPTLIVNMIMVMKENYPI